MYRASQQQSHSIYHSIDVLRRDVRQEFQNKIEAPVPQDDDVVRLDVRLCSLLDLLEQETGTSLPVVELGEEVETGPNVLPPALRKMQA